MEVCPVTPICGCLTSEMTPYDLQVLNCFGSLSLALVGLKLVHDSLNSLADRYVSRTRATQSKTILEKVRVD